MDGFEQARRRAFDIEVARGGQTDSASHRGGEVREDVTEEVVGDDDVVAGGVGDHVDRARIGVLIVDGHLGVLGPDLLDHATPQVTRMDHDIVLVHIGQLLVPGLGAFEGIAHGPFDAVPGVDRDLGRHLVGSVGAHGSTGSGVGALGALADDDEVDLARVRQRTRHTGEQLRGTQIHRMPEAEAHLEDDAALEHARGNGRVTAGAEEDGVVAAQRLELLIGQRLPRLVPALSADGVIGELEIDGLT